MVAKKNKEDLSRRIARVALADEKVKARLMVSVVKVISVLEQACKYCY